MVRSTVKGVIIDTAIIVGFVVAVAMLEIACRVTK
jgi:hypothetical protein